MDNLLRRMQNNRYIIPILKIILSLVIVETSIHSLFLNGLDPYYSYNGTNRYLSAGSIFELGLNVIFSVLFIFALCYSIFKFENFYHYYTISIKKQGIWYAAYFSVSFTLLYNPINGVRNEVTEFNRVIGNALAENVDVSKRVSNFSHWFILFGVSFVLFFLLSNYLLQKDWGGAECNKAVDFLHNLIVIANVNLALRCITYFYDQENSVTVFHYSAYFIMVAMIAVFAYIALKLEQIITADMYAKLMMIGFSIAYSIAFIFTREWDRSRILLGVQTILFTACILLIKLGKNILNTKQVTSRINGTVIFMSMIPFVTSFYIELINILNRHGVALSHMRSKYMIGILIWFMITCVFVFVACKRQWIIKGWKTWSYPWLVFGVSCLSVQLPLEQIYSADLFESANSSVLISDFLNFGSLPIVEHFGGHMMTDVWEGLIYAVLNSDYTGAIFSPYSGYLLPVLAVLFFYFIKYIWDEDAALFVTLFFPFYGSWSYFGLGMIVCMAIIAYLKKNTYPRAILVWFSVIWCILYRLDLGSSYAIAGSIALLTYIVMYRKWKAVKPLLLSLIGWGFIGGTSWFILCFMKGIRPFMRLLEFLAASLSNVNWAYATIGDAGLTVFAWAYIFVPFTMVIGLIYTIASKRLREQTGETGWMILLIMELAYFANYSRGLVRHSLAESSTFIIMWSGYICAAALIGLYKNNKRLLLPAFMLLILCDTAFLQGGNFTDVPISDTAALNMGAPRETWSQWKEAYENGEPITRVKWDVNLEGTIEPYRTVADVLLDDDETFVDFINKSFVYSAVNRKNPAYVSQSPGQLSGEIAQELFIDEIQDIPIVLMPINTEHYGYSNSLDGITNAYRYYKVVEYIYQNYEPLCKYDDLFTVWCLRDRYNEMKEKAYNLIHKGLPCELIEYGYGEPISNEDESTPYISALHSHSIGHIPRIWARTDDAINNDVIADLALQGNIFTFDAGSVIDRTDGNYLLINVTYNREDMVSDDRETIGVDIIVGKYENDVFTEKYRYNVIMSEGNHNYLIRISTDYYWYTEDVNAVCIQSDASLQDVTMSILRGD